MWRILPSLVSLTFGYLSTHFLRIFRHVVVFAFHPLIPPGAFLMIEARPRISTLLKFIWLLIVFHSIENLFARLVLLLSFEFDTLFYPPHMLMCFERKLTRTLMVMSAAIFLSNLLLSEWLLEIAFFNKFLRPFHLYSHELRISLVSYWLAIKRLLVRFLSLNL